MLVRASPPPSQHDDMDDEIPFLKNEMTAAGNPPLFYMARQRTRVSEEIKRFWPCSIRRFPSSGPGNVLNTRDGAFYSIVEALMFSLRRGPTNWPNANTLQRLARLYEDSCSR